MKFRFSSDFVVDSDTEPWRREGLRIAMLGGPGSGKSWNNSLTAEQFLTQGGTVVIFQPRDEYFCVAPDTPVLLQDGRVVTTDELATMVEAGKMPKIWSLVERKSSEKAFGNYYKFIPKSVTIVSRQKVSTIIEVKGRLGRLIHGTPNHKILITRKSGNGRRKPFWCTLADVKVGDRLVIPHQMPMHKGYIIRRLPLQNLHKSKFVEEDGWLIWTANIAKTYWPRIKKVTHYSVELAEWLGYFLADGHLSKKLLKIMYVKGNQCLRRRFARLSHEIFGVEGKEIPSKDCYCINNKALGVFLKRVLKIQSGRKSHILQLPDIVMQSGIKEIKAFLQAYLQSDGDGERHLSTSSKTAASQLCYLFERIGKHVSLTKTDLSKRELNFNPSTQFHYRITIPKGRHLAYKRKGIFDTVKVTEVNKLEGQHEVIGTLVPGAHNMILGQTPLISHNTLKEKFDVLSVGGVHVKDMEFALTSPSIYAKAVVEDGISMIFYTSVADDEEKLINWVSRFIRHVLNYQERHKRPLLLILEEAQEYAPRTASGHVAPPWVYNRMVKAFKDCFTQGRKLNMIAIASSQRPQELNFTIRQLANLTFFGKFSDQDIEYVDKGCLTYIRKRGIEIDASRLVDLGLGEWLVIMGKQTGFVKVTHPRLTKHGAETPRLEYVAPRTTQVKKTIDQLTTTILEALKKEEAEKSELEKVKRKIRDLTKKLEAAEKKAEIKLSVKEMLQAGSGAPELAEKLAKAEAEIKDLRKKLAEKKSPKEIEKLRKTIVQLKDEKTCLEKDLASANAVIEKLTHFKKDDEAIRKIKEGLLQLLPKPGLELGAPSEVAVDMEQPALTLNVHRKPLTLQQSDLLGRIAIVYAEGLLPSDKAFTLRHLNQVMEQRFGRKEAYANFNEVLTDLVAWGFLEKVKSGKRWDYRVKMKPEEAKQKGLLKTVER